MAIVIFIRLVKKKMLLVNAQDVPCVSYMHLALGVEAEVVETTDVREGIMEEEGREGKGIYVLFLHRDCG